MEKKDPIFLSNFFRVNYTIFPTLFILKNIRMIINLLESFRALHC